MFNEHLDLAYTLPVEKVDVNKHHRLYQIFGMLHSVLEVIQEGRRKLDLLMTDLGRFRGRILKDLVPALPLALVVCYYVDCCYYYEEYYEKQCYQQQLWSFEVELLSPSLEYEQLQTRPQLLICDNLALDVESIDVG